MDNKNDSNQTPQGFGSISQEDSKAQPMSIFSTNSLQSSSKVQRSSNIFGSSIMPLENDGTSRQSSIFCQGDVQNNPFRSSKILVNPHFGAGETSKQTQSAIFGSRSSDVFAQPEKPPPLVSRPGPMLKRKRGQEEDQDDRPKTVLNRKPRQCSAGLPKDLNHLMKIRVESDEERWNLLKEVDSILYKGQDDREEDANLQGICKDMCPEKERYGRSFKNQLRVYEKVNGDLDHRLAVKEHSRSAADQEIPPPTELRTLKALNMTMDHLIHNIVSRMDLVLDDVQEEWSQIPLSEWYLFIWSSTRAIRKEVTQQNLFSFQGLEILLKILRFHMVCNEEMADETNFSFDRKLNDENAIKCLKTITQMIEDGVQCNQEPEIRSYEILYNLNDGQVLLAISKLPRKLRNHPEIKFAIQMHSAVSSSNPVKFFKLMKKASYLQACILKRYVYQMRLIALKLTRVFVPGKTMIELPMSKMMEWLYMEDYSECGKFLRSHGFEYEDETVFVERSSFSPPEEIANQGSSTLIRAKMTCSLEEAVNGGPLGRNPLFKFEPHESFTEDGYLRQDLMNESFDISLNTTVDSQAIVDEEEHDVEQEEIVDEGCDDLSENFSQEELIEEEEDEEFFEASNYEEEEEDEDELPSTDEAPETEPMKASENLDANEDDNYDVPRPIATPSEVNVETIEDLKVENIADDREIERSRNETELVEIALDTVMHDIAKDLISQEVAKEMKLKATLSHDVDVMEDIVEEFIRTEAKEIATKVQDNLEGFIVRHEAMVYESLLDNLITETTAAIQEELNLERMKKYFAIWRRNAKASAMTRKGYRMYRVQDYLETFSYNRIVKFILTQHGHRAARDKPSPPPEEIITFINTELDNIFESITIEEGEEKLWDEISKLKLPTFKATTQPDWRKSTVDIMSYVETVNVPGAAILRSNIERIVRESTVGRENPNHLPYLLIFSEIFCHRMLYHQLPSLVLNTVLWIKSSGLSLPSFTFSSPSKRKESPTVKEVEREPKRHCPNSQILKAARNELTKSKRFEQMLSEALEDQPSFSVRVTPSKAGKASYASIELLKNEIEEEKRKSLEFERKLQMFM